MSHQITYVDRLTQKQEIEKVYGGGALRFVYGDNWISRFIGRPLGWIGSKFALCSHLYGLYQKSSCSARKIKPFIQYFNVDATEFADSVDSFRSFNDFFCRHLKPEARPIDGDANSAVMPADGRYLFYPNIAKADGFVVKGKKFDIATLVGSSSLAASYLNGSMIMARLCPTDYHRFHFPCTGTPGASSIINGCLLSVNPLAIKRNIETFSENKRSICELSTELFGKVLLIEVGAMAVGTIGQTYEPQTLCKKGAEKGFFSFGGSSVIILFKQNRIVFDEDLLQLSKGHIEVKCLMGQSLGRRK